MLVKVGGASVNLIDEGDVIARRLSNGKDWEDETRAMWRELVRGGQTVVDVGAYTGIYSIASAMMGANVIALEPHPANMKRLRENVMNNNVGVDAFEVAASNVEDVRHMHAKRWDAPCDTGSLVRNGEPAMRVKTVRLDQLHFKSPVCLLKLDVEGYEVTSLLGAMGLIMTYSPKVLIETLSPGAAVSAGVLMTGLKYGKRMRLDKRNELWVKT